VVQSPETVTPLYDYEILLKDAIQWHDGKGPIDCSNLAVFKEALIYVPSFLVPTHSNTYFKPSGLITPRKLMASSTPPPPPGLSKSMAEKTHQFDPENRKETADSEDNGAEKPRVSEDGSTTEDKPMATPQESVAYPKGIELLCIMLALVLSITLCSLDQVGSITVALSQYTTMS
jgi:hypothetical protein